MHWRVKVAFMLLAPTVAFTQSPPLINYQGRLEQNGATVPNGKYNLTFRIHGGESGFTNVKWQSTDSVTVTNGSFSYVLGQRDRIPDTAFTGTGARWLGITVGDPSALELSPRQQVTSVPYAVHAEQLGRSVFVDTSGRVGIGTRIPSTALEVAGKVKLRNAFSGPNGAVVYTDDVDYLFLGSESGTSVNGANITIAGSRNDQTSVPGGIRFNVPGCNYALTLDSSGMVGLGTIAPTAKLEISGGPLWTEAPWYKSIKLQSSCAIEFDAVSAKFGIGASPNAPGLYFILTTSEGIGARSYPMWINQKGTVNITDLTRESDRRLKTDIAPLKSSLQSVLSLTGVSYYWRTKEFPQRGFRQEKQIGLIAQDVERVLPELVSTDSEGFKSLDYDKLTPVLVEAMKEQQVTIDRQQEEMIALKLRLDAVELALKNLSRAEER